MEVAVWPPYLSPCLSALLILQQLYHLGSFWSFTCKRQGDTISADQRGSPPSVSNLAGFPDALPAAGRGTEKCHSVLDLLSTGPGLPFCQPCLQTDTSDLGGRGVGFLGSFLKRHFLGSSSNYQNLIDMSRPCASGPCPCHPNGSHALIKP